MTKEQALQKLKHYCAYSERCQADVTSRLYEWGVWRSYHDEIMATLIEENYLNEERYAKAYAGGHFRQKLWGRNKIKQYLKLNNISPYCIKKAIQEIDNEAYLDVLQKLFDEKWNSLKGEKNRLVKMKKTTAFLLQKGFEADLINKCFPK